MPHPRGVFVFAARVGQHSAHTPQNCHPERVTRSYLHNGHQSAARMAALGERFAGAFEAAGSGAVWPLESAPLWSLWWCAPWWAPILGQGGGISERSDLPSANCMRKSWLENAGASL